MHEDIIKSPVWGVLYMMSLPYGHSYGALVLDATIYPLWIAFLSSKHKIDLLHPKYQTSNRIPQKFSKEKKLIFSIWEIKITQKKWIRSH